MNQSMKKVKLCSFVVLPVLGKGSREGRGYKPLSVFEKIRFRVTF
jgi:hypothetical protein